MRKAVFLDRDGTINIEKNYLYKIEDFEFLPGVFEALKLIQKKGYLLIIISNQSGIGRGFYTEKDFEVLTDWMLKKLKLEGIIINGIYYCPHHPNASKQKYKINCRCRKPGIAMFEKAIEDFNIELEKSYVVGDKFRDCKICMQSKCKGFLIGENEKIDLIDQVKGHKFKNIRYAKDLYDAAKIIYEEGN